MQLSEAIVKAKEQLQSILNLEVSSVIGASKREDGWQVMIELIERKAVPDTQDLLGVYEVLVNDKGSMINYERKRLRRRIDLEEAVE